MIVVEEYAVDEEDLTVWVEDHAQNVRAIIKEPITICEIGSESNTEDGDTVSGRPCSITHLGPPVMIIYAALDTSRQH